MFSKYTNDDVAPLSLIILTWLFLISLFLFPFLFFSGGGGRGGSSKNIWDYEGATGKISDEEGGKHVLQRQSIKTHKPHPPLPHKNERSLARRVMQFDAMWETSGDT